MINIERELPLKRLDDFLSLLSETESHHGTYIGADATHILQNWLTGDRWCSKLQIPEKFLAQDYLTLGPCPSTGVQVYYACDVDRALAWLVGHGVITEEEMLWIQTRRTLELVEPV